MPAFVMLIKMSPELAKNFKSMEEIGKKVGAKYKEACPGVNVTHHLALLGPYDFMDILEAPDAETAYRMAAVIMSSGMASSVETWTAFHFTYPKMKELLGDL
ncbi:MAG TPA: GYD domain-containing protein [Blastocatellia bacterium]|nr:GYD domain-containing protein [Blastocatellia bacterium]